MGIIDRIVRVIVAVLIAGLYLSGIVKGTLAVFLLLVAGVFILTSAVSFCPLYTLVGLNTCSKK